MDWKKILKRVLLGIIVAYVGLVIYRIPAVAEKQRTEEAVARIHAQKLTLDTVMGKYLPEAPDPVANDATVEGIDRNNNGIRDDVELAIFKKYPNSARIRAAELQYAMSLQTTLREVFNTGTLIAASQESSRGSSCVFSTSPKVSLSDTEEVVKKAFAVGDFRIQEVDDSVLNTSLRKDKYQEIYRKYMTSFGDVDKQKCDIDLSTLSN